MIPTLPIALLEMLESPIPLIVGITEYEYSTLLEEELDDTD